MIMLIICHVYDHVNYMLYMTMLVICHIHDQVMFMTILVI